MRQTIDKIIDEQIERWRTRKNNSNSAAVDSINLITISRECGSRGQQIAEQLAAKTGFDLFNREILEAMFQESNSSKALLETLDEKSNSIVEDIISALFNDHYLWPDDYSRLLIKIINTIGQHGNAVILGRGANFALEKLNALKVRIIAPASKRLEYIQQTKDLSYDDARKYMMSTDSNRNAFVKRYFNCDPTDPSHYDIILNTGTFSVDKVVELIQSAAKLD